MIDKNLLAANKEKCLERAAKLPEAPASANESTCPVAWCLDMVKAARADACGKSVMCRDGLWQLQLMLEGIMNGQSNADDLDVMKETLVAMKTVGCPNTQKVATLILTSLEQNAEEWDLHVRRHRCTAVPTAPSRSMAARSSPERPPIPCPLAPSVQRAALLLAADGDVAAVNVGGQHRTNASATFSRSFTPEMRRFPLKYTKYSCGKTSFSERKISG